MREQRVAKRTVSADNESTNVMTVLGKVPPSTAVQHLMNQALIFVRPDRPLKEKKEDGVKPPQEEYSDNDVDYEADSTEGDGQFALGDQPSTIQTALSEQLPKLALSDPPPLEQPASSDQTTTGLPALSDKLSTALSRDLSISQDEKGTAHQRKRVMKSSQTLLQALTRAGSSSRWNCSPRGMRERGSANPPYVSEV